MELRQVAERASAVLDEVERAVVGKRDRLELVLAGLLADGHVLLEDVPGLAKTLTARSFAEVTGLRFTRVQFTPDLLPSDVTGSSIWNQRDSAFEFRAGPIFTNILLADEINRAPPKTQAALLEAMQERQVSIDGDTRLLEPPFLVLATQNPIEYEGTYPLPEAQLDRFLLRTGFGYPSADAEWEMLERRLERRVDEVELRQVVDRETLLEMQRAVEGVHVDESVGRYVVDLVAATRESPSVSVGSSPRGSLALVKLSRCRAALAGRDFVTPDDVKERRGPRSRAPPRPPPRALGPAPERRGRRPRDPRRGPDARHRDARDTHARRAARRVRGARRRRSRGGARPPAHRARGGGCALRAARRAGRPRAGPQGSVPGSTSTASARWRGTCSRRPSRCAPRKLSTASRSGSRSRTGIELDEGRNPVALRLAGGEERELPLRLRCTRWSSVEIGRGLASRA